MAKNTNSDNAIKSYLTTLEDDQKSRKDKITNFERFVNANDHEGLMSIGKALSTLKLEYGMTREFLYNINNAMRVKND